VNANTNKLHALGQSLWLDNITRQMLDDGTLARYVAELSISGLTSNPTIFEHAIGKGHAYDEQIAWQALVAHPCEFWSIDSFDQWSIELGNKLAERTLAELESGGEPKLAHDSSTKALIRRYRHLRDHEASS